MIRNTFMLTGLMLFATGVCAQSPNEIIDDLESRGELREIHKNSVDLPDGIAFGAIVRRTARKEAASEGEWAEQTSYDLKIPIEAAESLAVVLVRADANIKQQNSEAAVVVCNGKVPRAYGDPGFALMAAYDDELENILSREYAKANEAMSGIERDALNRLVAARKENIIHYKADYQKVADRQEMSADELTTTFCMAVGE